MVAIGTVCGSAEENIGKSCRIHDQGMPECRAEDRPAIRNSLKTANAGRGHARDQTETGFREPQDRPDRDLRRRPDQLNAAFAAAYAREIAVANEEVSHLDEMMAQDPQKISGTTHGDWLALSLCEQDQQSDGVVGKAGQFARQPRAMRQEKYLPRWPFWLGPNSTDPSLAPPGVRHDERPGARITNQKLDNTVVRSGKCRQRGKLRSARLAEGARTVTARSTGAPVTMRG